MKNKLPKHDVHTLPDGRLVVYMPGKFVNLWPYHNVFVRYEGRFGTPRKIIAWVMDPKYWDACIKGFQSPPSPPRDFPDVIERGFWRFRGIPVYRGKLKTRIKQLEEEIKHKPVMDEETFKKLKPETEAVMDINGTYLGGHLEKPKETTKIFYNPGNSDQDLVFAFLLGVACATLTNVGIIVVIFIL